MIPKEEINIGSLVIYVNYGKNFLAKIVSEGRPIQDRIELSRFDIKYNDSKLITCSTYNDAFRGIELRDWVTGYRLGFMISGFYLDSKGVLTFKDEIYSEQPIYLHQFQKVYFDMYGAELPLNEDHLEKYVSTIGYQKILDDNRNVIQITLKEGSKGAEIFKKMKAEKDAFREAVISGKLNGSVRKESKTINADGAISNQY